MKKIIENYQIWLDIGRTGWILINSVVKLHFKIIGICLRRCLIGIRYLKFGSWWDGTCLCVCNNMIVTTSSNMGWSDQHRLQWPQPGRNYHTTFKPHWKNFLIFSTEIFSVVFCFISVSTFIILFFLGQLTGVTPALTDLVATRPVSSQARCLWTRETKICN